MAGNGISYLLPVAVTYTFWVHVFNETLVMHKNVSQFLKIGKIWKIEKEDKEKEDLLNFPKFTHFFP